MTKRTQVNLTAIMLDDGIQKIERTAGRFLVRLTDGRCGVGGDVGEAYRRACSPDAENVLKVAA